MNKGVRKSVRNVYKEPCYLCHTPQGPVHCAVERMLIKPQASHRGKDDGEKQKSFQHRE